MLLSEVLSFQQFDLIARKAMEGFITGLHKSPFHGFSVEFAEHRSYNEGESVRNLDWKLLAKTDKKYIKQFNEETNLKCHLWIDVSPSMTYPAPNFEKLKFGVLGAAAICNLLQNQRDAFGISLFSENAVLSKTELKSTRLHLQNCLHILNPYWENSSDNKKPFSPLSQLAESVKRRNMVVVFSDLLWNPSEAEQENAFWETISMLKFQRCEVLLFHITHYEHEVLLNLPEDRPIKFIDLESGDQLKLQPIEIQEAYQQFQQKQTKLWEEKCLQLGIEYFLADVSQPIETVINEFYIQRAKLS